MTNIIFSKNMLYEKFQLFLVNNFYPSGKLILFLEYTEWILSSNICNSCIFNAQIYFIGGAQDFKAEYMGTNQVVFCTDYCSPAE